MPMTQKAKMWACLVLSALCTAMLMGLGAPACILLPFILMALISVGGLMWEANRAAVRAAKARAQAEAVAQTLSAPSEAPPIRSQTNTRMRLPESRYE